MKKENWVWMPHPGHFICASDCKFHLTTYVGGFIVSTIGEYLPDAEEREMFAKAEGVVLDGVGINRRRDYLKKIGFEEIGCDRKYETMVFKAAKTKPDSCCPYRVTSYSELDMDGYNTPEDAFKGHLALCNKWAKKKDRQ